MKTFIYRMGNKSKHINKFKDLIPIKFNNYIEPFVGSGAMLFYLQPKKFIINDIDSLLIEIYNLIKLDLDYIYQYFKKIENNIKKLNNYEKKIFCNMITDSLNYKYLNKEKILNFWLMTLFSYNGSIIVNNKYYFKGLNKTIILKDQYNFFSINFFQNLKNINIYLNDKSENKKIYNKDYKEILKLAKKNDFVFLDPPYYYKNSLGFNYNKFEKIDLNFIKELLIECKKLDDKGIKWLMTQSDTDEIKNLFKNYEISEIKVYRMSKKCFVSELIIRNFI